MKKEFQFIATLLLAIIGQSSHAQDKAITFSNDGNAYYSKAMPKDGHIRFFEPKINEITLSPDATFEFWSRPNVSCFTWHNYKGVWNRRNDTLIFTDSYQVEETDTKATYKTDAKQEFEITFKTDKGSILKNRSMKIQYEYDYDAHIDSPEEIFSLDATNSVVIPYNEIPNMDKLAAIRIEYLLNYAEKRYSYLTESKTINVKQGSIPNRIEVEFVENPKNETVFRTIKAVVRNDTLRFVSSTKTKSLLPDYAPEIEFEESYRINK